MPVGVVASERQGDDCDPSCEGCGDGPDRAGLCPRCFAREDPAAALRFLARLSAERERWAGNVLAYAVMERAVSRVSP